MISFFIAIIALILGYVIYGRYVEKLMVVDNNTPTPAISKKDGVDFMSMATWRAFMIEFLNIAGLGPIFGAILGAMYGPMAYVWIVLGCIFMGAAHDYFSGMLSLRHNGASISEIVGRYLGPIALIVMRGFTLVLLILVGVAFVSGPAGLLSALFKPSELSSWLEINGGVFSSLFANGSYLIWLFLIFIYYIAATILPIDKIIGRIYPVFGVLLLIMALGIGGAMIWKGLSGELIISELKLSDFKNFQMNPAQNLLFPMMFVVISCGAISGFHSTQAPMMARCIKRESNGRVVFYGAMIAEGIVTLIWATAAMNFYGGADELNQVVTVQKQSPAFIVNFISNTWLGQTGAILAILGVVVCPITTGDTAFRSARLTLADMFSFDQKTLMQRLKIAFPLFLIGFLMSKIEFVTIWKYLGLANQLLSAIVLWTIAVYLQQKQKNHWVMSLPAMFMTSVCIAYFISAPYLSGGLALSPLSGYIVGISGAIFCMILFMRKKS